MKNQKISFNKRQLSFNNFPNELKEKILICVGSEFHHLLMTVSRDWYHIINDYRRRNKMPHTRKININKFYPYSTNYIDWSIKNNLSPVLICSQIIKKCSIDIIKWFTIKYRKIICDHFNTDKGNVILKMIIQINNLDIFKWIYECVIWGPDKEVIARDGNISAVNYIKGCVIQEHRLDILRYLLADVRISFDIRNFIQAIQFKFTEGVKLLHKEEYCDDPLIMDLAFAYFTNIETIQWMENNHYIYNIMNYREYMIRQLPVI